MIFMGGKVYNDNNSLHINPSTFLIAIHKGHTILLSRGWKHIPLQKESHTASILKLVMFFLSN